MIERGMVKEIRDRLVTVQLEIQECCGACNNSSCKENRQSIQAFNGEDIVLSEGESVEVEIQGSAQASGAFWVLGMPLALLVGGYFAGRALFPHAGEGPAALFGLGALALGMVMGVLIQKGKKLETLPRVIRAWRPEIDTSLPTS
jgi:positive regulator of sigma E activity